MSVELKKMDSGKCPGVAHGAMSKNSQSTNRRMVAKKFKIRYFTSA